MSAPRDSPIPAVQSRWRKRRTSTLYTVVGIANEAIEEPGHPVTVVFVEKGVRGLITQPLDMFRRGWVGVPRA